MRTCIDAASGNRESFFEPCNALDHYAKGVTAVLQFEGTVVIILGLAWIWRRRLLLEKGMA